MAQPRTFFAGNNSKRAQAIEKVRQACRMISEEVHANDLSQAIYHLQFIVEMLPEPEDENVNWRLGAFEAGLVKKHINQILNLAFNIAPKEMYKVLYAQAEFFLKIRDTKAALSAYHLMSINAPSYWEGLYTYAWLLHRTGENSKALRWLDKIILSDGDGLAGRAGDLRGTILSRQQKNVLPSHRRR